MGLNNATMARKSAKAGGDSPRKDPHKPRRMVGIRKALADQLELLAEREATDITELANRAVKELLEKHKLWPAISDAS